MVRNGGVVFEKQHPLRETLAQSYAANCFRQRFSLGPARHHLHDGFFTVVQIEVRPLIAVEAPQVPVFAHRTALWISVYIVGAGPVVVGLMYLA